MENVQIILNTESTLCLLFVTQVHLKKFEYREKVIFL